MCSRTDVCDHFPEVKDVPNINIAENEVVELCSVAIHTIRELT